jgi:hypothetical protein
MPGLDVRPSGEVGCEHREIIRDDGIEFVISPRFSDLFFISHRISLYLSGKCCNRDSAPVPIYVGKAIPIGGRKGELQFDATIGSALYKRLSEHAESIRQVNNLSLPDFKCRYLVVDDIWIPLGESLLIRQFRPLWNVAIDGFGNHDPGSGRHRQQKSPWDVLHPGRSWAERLAPCTKTRQGLIAQIDKHFA